MAVPLLLALACAAPVAASPADRTGPEFLRAKHAGSKVFEVPGSVAELYPRLLEATRACWDGGTRPHDTSAVGGAAAAVTEASRGAIGVLSEGGDHAHVMVRAEGAMGMLRANFLQIDLDTVSTGVRVTAYHRSGVKAQREFLDEVAHWIDGEATFCHPKPLIHKARAN